MSTIKERYQEALALAKTGDYTKALALLKTIDHVKARTLESQIRARMSPAPTWNARRVIVLMVFVVFLAAVGYVANLAIQRQRELAMYSALRDICWDAYFDSMGAGRYDYCRGAVETAFDIYGDEIHNCYNQYGGDANPTPFVRCMADNGVKL